MIRVRKHLFKRIHLASTMFFAMSTCYLLAASLHRSGTNWKVIAPVSAYSLPILVFLIIWYLFAVYRGMARDRMLESEHPFTTGRVYLLFYKLAPLSGGVAGMVAVSGSEISGNLGLMTAAGAVFTTFLVWLFVDPVVGLAEMLLPSSRRHRRERLTRERMELEQRQAARKFILSEVEKIEQIEHQKWDEALTPLAQTLACRVCANCGSIEKNVADVVDIGVRLWQYGGLECMKYIHSIAAQLCRQRCKLPEGIDCISLWWQGIGNWPAAPPVVKSATKPAGPSLPDKGASTGAGDIAN